MKKLVNLFLSATIALAFVSCGSGVDSSIPPAERIHGAWKIVKAEGSMAELNEGTVYKWAGNMMTTSKNDFDVTGEYLATDSTILWKAGTIEMNYGYHFEDNKLVIELTGGDQKFFLEKE